MIFKENRKYWMVSKTPITTLLTILVIALFVMLIYSIATTPNGFRNGIFPKISEIEMRFDSEIRRMDKEFDDRSLRLIDNRMKQRIMQSSFKGNKSR